MADYNGAVYTAQVAAADNAASMIDTAELISGKVSYLQATWVAPSGTAADETVALCVVPSGMTLIPGLSTASISVDTASLVGDLEIAGNPVTRFIDLSTNGTVNLMENEALTNVSSYGFSERATLELKISGTVTTGAVFTFNLFLVNSN